MFRIKFNRLRKKEIMLKNKLLYCKLNALFLDCGLTDVPTNLPSFPHVYMYI